MAHIIITGGSSGVGLAMAEYYVKRSDQVTLIARDTHKLEQAKSKLLALKNSNATNVLTISADVAVQEDVEKAILESITKYGSPDILVTSAGMLKLGEFSKQSIQDHKANLNTNYFGTIYSIKAVLPYMEQAKKGKIIIIASALGLIGIYGYTGYCASKFALRGFAESLYYELFDQNISITVAYLPDVNTPQHEYEKATRPKKSLVFAEGNKAITAKQAANYIIRAAEKNKLSVAPTFLVNCLWRFNSFLLPILRKYYKRGINKVKD